MGPNQPYWTHNFSDPGPLTPPARLLVRSFTNELSEFL